MGQDYLVNNPSIASERFDAEVVLVSIEKGLYYSLTGAAVDIYDAFIRGAPRVQVLDSLCASMPGAVRSELESAVEKLTELELLLPASAANCGEPASISTKAFETPVIAMFDDLAELIAIDPVHDVEASTGWPVRPAKFAEIT